MFSREPHADCGAERQPRDVCLWNPERVDERGYIVRIAFDGNLSIRIVALTRAAQVQCVNGEMLRVLGNLECVALIIRTQVRNEDQRLAASLLFVVDVDSVCFNLRHSNLLTQLKSYSDCSYDFRHAF